jgi:hypothetical protein
VSAARATSSATCSSSGSATVTHTSTGTRPSAGQRAAAANAHATTGGVRTATNAAKATSGGVGAWIAGAVTGVHPVCGSIGPYLVRPVVIARTAAIVDRRASVHRTVRGVADLGEGRTRSYQRRSEDGQDREFRQ